jgi:hypothetical protein
VCRPSLSRRFVICLEHLGEYLPNPRLLPIRLRRRLLRPLRSTQYPDHGVGGERTSRDEQRTGVINGPALRGCPRSRGTGSTDNPPRGARLSPIAPLARPLVRRQVLRLLHVRPARLSLRIRPRAKSHQLRSCWQTCRTPSSACRSCRWLRPPRRRRSRPSHRRQHSPHYHHSRHSGPQQLLGSHFRRCHRGRQALPLPQCRRTLYRRQRFRVLDRYNRASRHQHGASRGAATLIAWTRRSSSCPTTAGLPAGATRTGAIASRLS